MASLCFGLKCRIRNSRITGKKNRNVDPNMIFSKRNLNPSTRGSINFSTCFILQLQMCEMIRDFPSRAKDENPYVRWDSNIGSDPVSDSDRKLHGTRHVQNSVEKYSNLDNLSLVKTLHSYFYLKKSHINQFLRQFLHGL